MSQGSRPDRVADQIRGELATLLAREVHDPGIGFVTLTRVQVTPDLQLARVHYTVLGDEKARAGSARALERAAPFLRRQIGARLRLRSARPSSGSSTTTRWPARTASSRSSASCTPPRRTGRRRMNADEAAGAANPDKI